MIHALAFLLDLSGFALLFLAMKRHQQDWLGRKLPPPRVRALRIAALAVFTFAFATCGAGLGWGYGAIAWFGLLTASALPIVIVNCKREAIRHRLKGAGR